MTAPQRPPDPDPRHADEDDLWDPASRSWVARPSPIPVLIAGALIGLILGLALGAAFATVTSAAPRTAQTTERVDLSAPSSAGPSGAPKLLSADAPPSGGRNFALGAPLITEPAAIAHGIASYVAPSYGPLYLALPDGPGIRVTICGPAACVTRTSTDAGPDLAMQREGRIADLSFADFAKVCGCEPSARGLVQVTVTDAGAGLTAPPTDVEP